MHTCTHHPVRVWPLTLPASLRLYSQSNCQLVITDPGFIFVVFQITRDWNNDFIDGISVMFKTIHSLCDQRLDNTPLLWKNSPRSNRTHYLSTQPGRYNAAFTWIQADSRRQTESTFWTTQEKQKKQSDGMAGWQNKTNNDYGGV